MIEEQEKQAAEASEPAKTAEPKPQRPLDPNANRSTTLSRKITSAEAAVAAKRTRATRPFPASTFKEALEFAKQMFEFASGQQVRRLTFFNHINKALGWAQRSSSLAPRIG